jgi:hypothetical protein
LQRHSFTQSFHASIDSSLIPLAKRIFLYHAHWRDVARQ